MDPEAAVCEMGDLYRRMVNAKMQSTKDRLAEDLWTVCAGFCEWRGYRVPLTNGARLALRWFRDTPEPGSQEVDHA